MTKKEVFIKGLLAFSLCALLVLPVAAAITASIGNSKMVLRLEPGDTIERSILTKNVNDFPVTVNLIPSGDLAESVVLEQDSFMLKAGEEKRAVFTITAGEEGTTETRINVQFKPEEGHSAGLSSTIIVIARSDHETPSQSEEELFDEEVQNDELGEESSEESSPVSVIPGTTPSGLEQVPSESGLFSPLVILGVSTLILAVIFIVLALNYQGVGKKKKRIRRPHA